MSAGGVIVVYLGIPMWYGARINKSQGFCAILPGGKRWCWNTPLVENDWINPLYTATQLAVVEFEQAVDAALKVINDA